MLAIIQLHDNPNTNKERKIVMKKIAFVLAVIALILALAPPAKAQLAATRFICLVDTAAVITFSQYGEAEVPLDPHTGNTINLSGYHKVYVRVGTTSAKKIMVNMGKISGATLSQMFTRAMSQNIQAFDVVGPQMGLWLTGRPPNKTENVQIWVYITS